MKCKKLLLLSLVLSMISCKSQGEKLLDYETENLKIEQLTDHTFVHISYLETESWGKVPCNGMIVIDNDEAIVIDAPTNDGTTAELLNWLDNKLKCKVKAVVATHFHEDCIGGLNEFHKNGVTSYATNKTIGLIKGEVVPNNGFDTYLELGVGNEKLICEYLGEGHTVDNIISYFPSEKVMFGGCLIKSDGAGKGNLADANVREWSNTVQSLKRKYPEVRNVIPGHGKSDGLNLLDYTIKLFNVK